jgi:hypothetical protein
MKSKKIKANLKSRKFRPNLYGQNTKHENIIFPNAEKIKM